MQCRVKKALEFICIHKGGEENQATLPVTFSFYAVSLFRGIKTMNSGSFNSLLVHFTSFWTNYFPLENGQYILVFTMGTQWRTRNMARVVLYVLFIFPDFHIVNGPNIAAWSHAVSERNGNKGYDSFSISSLAIATEKEV